MKSPQHFGIIPEIVLTNVLLPLPFGPTIHVIPSVSSMVTGSANDLNPLISMRLKINCYPSALCCRALLAASCSASFLL